MADCQPSPGFRSPDTHDHDTRTRERNRWPATVLEQGIHQLFRSTSEPWIIKDAGCLSEGSHAGLCSICRQINFEWLLRNELDSHPWALANDGQGWSYINTSYSTTIDPGLDLSHPRCVQIPPDPGWHRLPRIPLGFLVDIAQRPGCPFCRLITKGVYNALQIPTFDALSTANVYGYGKYPLNKSFLATESICFLSNAAKGVGLGSSPGVFSLRLWIGGPRRFSTTRAVDIQELSVTKVPWFGRHMNPVVDTDILKSWLRVDEAGIPAHTLPPLSRNASDNFRLIDVEDYCVVKAAMDWRYLALSYVWGDEGNLQYSLALEAQLTQPHALESHNIPQTIQDAMELASSLGERYLWVDSLCILQDDSISKENQILAMDRVYALAIATIVAASGEGADSGLPGIRPGTRARYQHVEIVRGISMGNRWDVDTLTSTSPRDLLNCTEQTKWASRAWTFQELILSNRVIFFMKNAVWYQSRDHVFEEDVHEDFTSTIGEIYSNLMCTVGVPPKSTEDEEKVLSRYLWAIEIYSRRAMSFESDTLKAFAAVLNLFRPAFSTGYLSGIPALHLGEVLLWLPDSTILRRKNKNGEILFPSWSWSGWSGKLNMPDSRPRLNRVRWIKPDLNTLVKGGDQESIGDRLDNEKTLDFETLAANLPLKPGRGAIWRMKSASNRHLNPEICSYYIEDVTQRGDMAGIVYIHADGIKPWDDISFDYEMVVISRSTHHRLPGCESERPPPDDDLDLIEWAEKFSLDELRKAEAATGTAKPGYYNVDLDWGIYNVLVIAWEEGVAHRVGAGCAFAEAFHFARPVRKKIVLG